MYIHAKVVRKLLGIMFSIAKFIHLLLVLSYRPWEPQWQCRLSLVEHGIPLCRAWSGGSVPPWNSAQDREKRREGESGREGEERERERERERESEWVRVVLYMYPEMNTLATVQTQMPTSLTCLPSFLLFLEAPAWRHRSWPLPPASGWDTGGWCAYSASSLRHEWDT